MLTTTIIVPSDFSGFGARATKVVQAESGPRIDFKLLSGLVWKGLWGLRVEGVRGLVLNFWGLGASVLWNCAALRKLSCLRLLASFRLVAIFPRSSTWSLSLGCRVRDQLLSNIPRLIYPARHSPVKGFSEIAQQN